MILDTLAMFLSKIMFFTSSPLKFLSVNKNINPHLKPSQTIGKTKLFSNKFCLFSKKNLSFVKTKKSSSFSKFSTTNFFSKKSFLGTPLQTKTFSSSLTKQAMFLKLLHYSHQ